MAIPIVTAGLSWPPESGAAVYAPASTPNPQPNAITTHPEARALEYLRVTAAQTPAPKRIRIAVPMTSPTNMSPLLMAAPRRWSREGRPCGRPKCRDVSLGDFSRGQGRSRAPPGVRDERAVTAESHVEERAVAQ